MAGVVRPYTLVDILGTLNQQSLSSQTTTLVNGIGFYAEADETVTGAADTATAIAVSVLPGWDQENWGAQGWA